MMKLSVYHSLVEYMQSAGSKSCLSTLSDQYPEYSYETLVSIYSQDRQRHTKINYHTHHLPEVMERYYERYKDESSRNPQEPVLLQLAQEIDFSPYLLARIVLERHLMHTQYENEPPPKSVISQLMKDTTKIEDPFLSYEIQQCILQDDVYGPLLDCIRHSVGVEYENKLQDTLREKNIAFLGEEEMRAKGYDKTPDIKLEVPIAIDGHIVNWIESKASFGDENSHKGYLKDQFWSYWNRFGSGMVIYWFGYINELDTHSDKGIILKDFFPEKVTTLGKI